MKLPEKFNRNIFLSIILLVAITFSVITIAVAVTPDPGHDFTQVSGGTAQGDILYGSATDILSALPKDANATRYLSNTGTLNNPAWAQINLANGVTGLLPNVNLANSSITVNGTAIALGASGTITAGADTALSNLVSPAINANLVGAVAGGMTISGGSAANDDLTLQGTTNATRTTSYVNLQPNGGNVGIGTAAPGVRLEVRGAANVAAPVLGTNTGSFSILSGNNGLYGLFMGTTDSGNVWLQTGHNDGGLSTYQIQLNPSGGNVTVGNDLRFSPTDPVNTITLLSGTSNLGITVSGGKKISLSSSASSDVGLTVDTGTGNVGIGTTLPTALLHLKSGTATANTAPLKLTSGVNLTTTEAGAIEYDGTHLYFTAADAGTRYQLDQQSAGAGANAALSNLSSVAINTDLIGAVTGGLGIRGGTAADDDLILEGTTNATRTTSYVNLQPNGGNVGIRTTSPSEALTVQGNFRLQDPSDTNLNFKITNVEATTNFPRTIFQGGSSISNVNWFMRFANAYSSSALNIPTGIQISTNNDFSFTNTNTLMILSGDSAHRIFSVNGSNDNGPAIQIDTSSGATSTPNLFLSTVSNGGNVGIGMTTPTAALHLKAGTATANTAPLKLTSGVNLTTTEAGAIEYDGTHLYFTAANAGTRYQLDQQSAGAGANTALSNLASVAINTDLVGAVTGGLGIRGGTAADDDLILEGTTNATRTTSYVNLQPNGGNVGIGTTGPAVTLDVRGTGISAPGAGAGSERFGLGALADSVNSLAVGPGAQTSTSGFNSGNLSIAIGKSALARNDRSVIIGSSATEAITAYAGKNVVIGASAQATTPAEGLAVAVGADAKAADTSVAIGSASEASSGSTAVGWLAKDLFGRGIALGSKATTTAESQFVVGATGDGVIGPIYQMYIGMGVLSPSAASANVSINATGGSGTDIAGANLTLAGGKPTGAGLGGSVIFSTAPAGATGTTLRDLVERMRIDSLGNVGIGLAPSVQFELSGSIGQKASGTTWSNPSDLRLKKDITPFTDGLNIINAINPVNYTLNGLAGTPEGTKAIGVIAQEIKDVAPYTVTAYQAKLHPGDANTTELFRFDASALTFALINSVKELDLKVENITGKDNDKLCIKSTCVTEEQLIALLQNAGINNSTSPTTAPPTPTPTPEPNPTPEPISPTTTPTPEPVVTPTPEPTPTPETTPPIPSPAPEPIPVPELPETGLLPLSANNPLYIILFFEILLLLGALLSSKLSTKINSTSGLTIATPEREPDTSIGASGSQISANLRTDTEQHDEQAFK